jgi:NDP-sugar pyrophosphorylase family protein
MQTFVENNNIGTGAASGLRAIVLAGGKGTRLAPFTASFPKPLVPLGDVPILEVLIRRLVRHGISNITLALGHLAELIKAYLENRKELTQGITLNYVREAEPTGTAGSLSLVEGLDKTFLVMNGDLLTNLNLHSLTKFHKERGAILTIASHAREVRVDLGIIEFDGDYRINRYLEKPTSTYFVSMGIYVYEPEVLNYIEPGKYLDFPDLALRLIKDRKNVCAFPSHCEWLDIGRPDDYARAQELYAQKKWELDLV